MSESRSVAILGATGSIGTQALDVIAAAPGAFEVRALAAGGESIQARTVAAQAHRAFGAPPATFPGQRPRASTPRPEPKQRPRPIDEPSPTSAYARALARTVNKIKKAGRDT